MSEIKELEQEILKHKALYYKGEPEISDFEYDALEEKLKKLDPSNYVLAYVGTEVFSEDKVEHAEKMLSLNKTYKEKELETWKADYELVSTFKIDGSSCSLIYEGGVFKLGKTRGDGKFGENITNKVLHIENVPKITTNYKNNFEVRGEVYCTEESFVELSEYMVSIGLERPSSLRNIVAGILGRKENINLASYLEFQAFELITDDIELKSELEKFEILKKMKFLTPEYSLIKNSKDIASQLDKAKEFMSDGNYLIDGIVFTYNEISLHEELGATAHHPRYKMAFKFQGETKDTTIESISWQVSRNGILTPVANVEPVDLSGAKVSRVTLHNYGMVKANNLKTGDKIKIVRSGEVIPKFLEVVKDSGNNFDVPENCPSCGTKVIEADIRLLCENIVCPSRVKDEILNFIQKVGIDDLSGKRLEELIKAGFVKKIDDLYDLTMEQLLSLDKVKDKLATKVLNNIEKTKEADFITFLSSLGIAGGAYNKCEKVVDAGIDTVDKLKKLTVEKLQNIESFAEKSATDFLSSLESKHSLIDSLVSKGFKFKVKEKKDSSITGKKFCITGTLTMKRSELQKIIKENSGIAVGSVSKATDYLITNDTESSSSKFKKAKELNIPIINESQFLEMVK